MRAGLAVGHDHLRGEPERGVDGGVRHRGVAQLLGPVDDVLGVVVDVGRAVVLERDPARVLHARGHHQRAAAARGLAEAELARGVDDDLDARRVDAQLGDGSLHRDRVHALAHLGEAVAHLDLADRLTGTGLRKRTTAAHTSRRPLPRPEFFRPETHADGLARGECGVDVRLGTVEALLGATGTVVHDLAGAPHLAGVDDVALAHLPPADADLLGEPVHHTLHRELRLVGAEAAERAAHRVVGAHGDALDVDVRHPVRAAGMAGRTLEHLHADARVRTGVADAAHLQRDQGTVLGASRPVLEADGVPLGVHEEALLARQRALHRTVEQPRGQRGLALVAHVLLATERATVGHQLDSDGVGADRFSRAAIWSRSSHTPWPPEYTCRCREPSSARDGTASVLSGSRNACSMRWVWNTSWTMCALADSAASTSPRW